MEGINTKHGEIIEGIEWCSDCERILERERVER